MGVVEELEAQREALTQACAVADAEDRVAQARCDQLLSEFAGSAQRLEARAAEFAAVAQAGGPPSEVSAAAVAVDAARADAMRAQIRVVDEWAAINKARLDRAHDLSQQVSRICESTSDLTDPA
ncbi:hypothetical protein [Cryptosporangium sp. NPDC048952]|uniref:hypothetical protein n=1 Tax=Cryptosporangium sp. NPDC048952 TaxID=3363961 RepID=UPI0037165D69